MLRGHRAHEHHRTREGVSSTAPGGGREDGMGLAPLPRCGEMLTCKWGSDPRHPWTFAGRATVRVQWQWCDGCKRTYSEESPWLVRGSW